MTEHIELRSRDAVASCLIRRLMVPRVYYEATWPHEDSPPVDVLAIDRDGVGDPHIVEIRGKASDSLATIPRLMAMSAPFRWIAYLSGTEDEAAAQSLISQKVLYPPSGAGRIGVIEIVETSGGDLGANIRIRAERFPLAVYDLATAFSGSHKANVQFGG